MTNLFESVPSNKPGATEQQPYTERRNQDGTTTIIDKDNKVLYEGPMSHSEFSDGHLFVERDNSDGTSTIISEGKRLYDGPVSSWKVSEGHLLVERRNADGSMSTIRDGEAI